MSWACRGARFTGESNNMVFKNFRLQVILRVLLLVLAIGITAWCLFNNFILRTVYSGIVVLVIVLEFILYVDRFNRDVRTFLISMQQRDFTTRFQASGRSKTFDELYGTLNNISELFRTISAEKEAQYRFLEMLVEHLRVGVFTVDDTGKVILINQALKDLLQKDVVFSLKSLGGYGTEFVEMLRDIRGGETKLFKLRVKNELLQLSIHASEFRLDNRYHKLISMQNIRNELEAHEMEAWQKLIRVLTHEIMNSVSPIISLSETMHGLVLQSSELQVPNRELSGTLDKGLQAIKARSQGLYNFTQSYRKLTGIPKVALKETTTGELIHRVTGLLENKMTERGIALKVKPLDVPLVADPVLMEHVLINLLMNAMDALAETKDPVIEIGAMRNGRGDAIIFVRDNGEGIDEATADKIFIPFFTTRKDGSGIGLALSKQILHLHHADLRFTSEKGIGTEFVIVF